MFKMIFNRGKITIFFMVGAYQNTTKMQKNHNQKDTQMKAKTKMTQTTMKRRQ